MMILPLSAKFVVAKCKGEIIMVNKDMTVGDVLEQYSNAQEILGGFGLHCFGCPMSRMETIEQAAAAHGVDLDFMLKKLNEDLTAEKTVKKCTKGCKKDKKD